MDLRRKSLMATTDILKKDFENEELVDVNDIEEDLEEDMEDGDDFELLEESDED